MRYTIFGFDQEDSIELGLGLDELLILDQIVNFFLSNNSVPIIYNGETYYWFAYSKLLDDLPILGIKNKRTVARKVDNLVKAGLLKKHVDKEGNGSRTYFQLTEKVYTLRNNDRKNRKYDEDKVDEPKVSNQDKYDKVPYFNEFWKAYPKKRSKGQALAPFKRNVKDKETLDKILEDIEFKLNNGVWNDFQFIPHASTYLNAEGWLDEKFIPKPQYKTREPITKANRGGTFEHIKPD